MLNLRRSLQLGKKTGAKAHFAYENAVIALTHLHNNNQANGVYYVEGYAVLSSGYPIEQAWLEDAKGEILDPTLWSWWVNTPEDKRSTPPFISYHPAIRYTYTQLIFQFHKQGYLPLAREGGEDCIYALNEAYKSAGAYLSL